MPHSKAGTIERAGVKESGKKLRSKHFLKLRQRLKCSIGGKAGEALQVVLDAF